MKKNIMFVFCFVALIIACGCGMNPKNMDAARIANNQADSLHWDSPLDSMLYIATDRKSTRLNSSH